MNTVVTNLFNKSFKSNIYFTLILILLTTSYLFSERFPRFNHPDAEENEYSPVILSFSNFQNYLYSIYIKKIGVNTGQIHNLVYIKTYYQNTHI